MFKNVRLVQRPVLRFNGTLHLHSLTLQFGTEFVATLGPGEPGLWHSAATRRLRHTTPGDNAWAPGNAGHLARESRQQILRGAEKEPSKTRPTSLACSLLLLLRTAYPTPAGVMWAPCHAGVGGPAQPVAGAASSAFHRPLAAFFCSARRRRQASTPYPVRTICSLFWLACPVIDPCVTGGCLSPRRALRRGETGEAAARRKLRRQGQR